MHTVEIDRLRASYHAPADRRDTVGALGRLLLSALDEPLGLALERAGIASGALICIRRMRVRLPVRHSAPEGAVVTDWAGMVAEAVRHAIASGDADVVRYRSEAAALLDLVVQVADRNVSRGWAWRQLRLWAPGDHATGIEATAAAVEALRARPRLIVPILSAVARDREAFGQLLRQLTPEEWERLAQHGLGAAGATISLRARSATEGAVPGPFAAPLPSAPTGEAPHVTVPVDAAMVARIFRGSIASRSASHRERLGARTCRSLAALALLEVDPASVRREPAWTQAVVGAVARAIGAGDARAARPGPQPASDGGGTASAHRGRAVPRHVRRRRRLRDPQDKVQAETPTEQALRANDGGMPPPLEQRGVGALATDPAVPDCVQVEGSDAIEVAETRFGGLLFLLNIVDELERLAKVLQDARLGRRTVRWTLHALAMRLAPLEPSDPAALAFCGLRPEDDPPSEGEGHTLEEERMAVDELANRVVWRLFERFAEGGAVPALPLPSVIERRGRIVADLGWIEMRLPFESVSLAVRRAGLDLDPGYLAWLGVVMRFVYA